MNFFTTKKINSIYKEFHNMQRFGTRRHSLLMHSFAPDVLLETMQCVQSDKYFLRNSDGMETPAYQCRFCPEYLYSNIAFIAKENGSILFIDTDNEAQNSYIQEFKAHNNCIFDAQWIGRDYLLTASGDMNIRLFDLSTECLISQFNGHTKSIKSLATRPEHNTDYASSSKDGTIRLWDIRTQINKIRINNVEIGSRNPKHTIFHAHDPKLAPKLRESKNNAERPVSCVIYLNSNTLVSSGSNDNIIKMWDLRKIDQNYKPVQEIVTHNQSELLKGFTDIVTNRAGNMLFAYGRDSFIYQYDLTSKCINEPVFMYGAHQCNSFYLKMDLSFDENYLASGCSRKAPIIYRVGMEDQQPLRLVSHEAEVSVCRWCPTDQGRLLTISDDCTARVYRMRTGRSPLRSLRNVITPDVDGIHPDRINGELCHIPKKGNDWLGTKPQPRNTVVSKDTYIGRSTLTVQVSSEPLAPMFTNMKNKTTEIKSTFFSESNITTALKNNKRSFENNDNIHTNSNNNQSKRSKTAPSILKTKTRKSTNKRNIENNENIAPPHNNQPKLSKTVNSPSILDFFQKK